MSETQTETKLYPGSIERYRALRAQRESLTPADGQESGENLNVLLAATIAEELAGLAYILDGIRYSARKG